MNAARESGKAVWEKSNPEQAKEIWGQIAAQISEAILLTDSGGKILWASPKTGRIFHKRLKNAEGLSLDVLCQPQSKSWTQLCRKAVKRPFRQKQVAFRCSKNTSILLDISVTPFAGSESKQMLLWVLTDRTAEKEQEANIQADKKNLEEFVYTVSHDLKAPLVSIEGYLSLLREENLDELSGDGKYFVEKISKNVRLMRRMIQDLLELSRIGREAPSKKLLSVGAILEEVLEEFRFQIEKKQIQLVLHERFPRIQGNPRHIRLLFSNLISNAIKFLGDQPEPRIEIGWNRGDATVHYFVRDNGLGIHPRYHDQIFRLFYRPKISGEEGSGVGLAIVKKIVEEHGGTVRVDSEEGKGATFFVSFPKPKGN